MKDFFKKYGRHLLGLFFLVLVGKKISEVEVLFILKQFTVEKVLLILALQIIYQALVSHPVVHIMRKMGTKISDRDGVFLAILTNLYNILLPVRAGVIVRGFILKNKFNFDYSRYISLSAYLSLFSMFTLGVVGGLTNYFISPDWYLKTPLNYLFALITLVSLLIRPLSRRINVNNVYLKNMKEGIQRLSSLKSALIIFVSYFLGLLTYSLRIYLIYSVIGVEISYLEMVYFTMLLLSISLIQLLPGNLGLKEASFSIGSMLFGHAISFDLLAALIDRGIQILTLSVLGLYYQISILKIDASFFFKSNKIGVSDA